MCGITGWIDWDRDLLHYPSVIKEMTETLTNRGPDASGTWLSSRCALGHRRLSVIDPENGAQPMQRIYGDHSYIIVYNGELYNALELRRELQSRGHTFRTLCDTEVLLVSYVEWGAACVDRLNGIFAFAVWDDKEQSLFMARDRLGVKPLFFSRHDGFFLFGSEPKAILANPFVTRQVGAEGMAEVFVIAPARTPGHGLYSQLNELKPGYCMRFDRNGANIYAYWKLENRPHTDDIETTAEKIRELLIDTVERQLVSDVPVCTLLSGGLDSSALTALSVQYYRETGRGPLHTYSVDYVDNDKHFQASAFQPNDDAPWIRRISEFLGTIHHDIRFDTPEQVDALKASVLARDMPGYADVDSSLYLFCREIKKDHTVALSGEAADEVFGGYPWFHREDALNAPTFPWSLRSKERVSLLSPELIEWVRPEQYLADRYEQALKEVPHEPGEDAYQQRIRVMSYLNITRFMTNLLDRKDRMSMAVGLEVRVPFCDHRLIEYVWNIPWDIKTAGMREKGILRKALKGVLPDDVLSRKKSPYPKTHNPNYSAAVRDLMLEVLDDSASPILPYLNVKRVREIAESGVETFDIPWFGQLMKGPQMFAYLYQVNYWLKEYQVSVK